MRGLGGRRLVDWALERARGYGGPIAISVRWPGQIAELDGLVEIYDPPGLEGPLAGLGAALTFADAQAAAHVLTIPCDMPWLPDELADQLLAGLGETALAALPVVGGELQAVCGLWRASCMARLEAYAATGRRSLKGFASFVGAVEVPWDQGASDRFLNINRPEELQAAESVLAERAS
ncbi:molybdopterin-guanine dinucleotide biosynthesis protein A [Caulobacter segnis]|nr:molybdopterin-guanine dinucleotide biosynthesis protein A [Caulobacter segnis]